MNKLRIIFILLLITSVLFSVDQGANSTVLLNVVGGECGYVNENITLYQNITGNGTCFIINTSSVTFDCNGFTIIGNTTGTGFENTFDDNTIENCIIQNFSIGIKTENNTNNTMHNNTLYVNLNNGISFINSSNNTLTNNTLNQSNNIKLDSNSDYNDIYYNFLYNGSSYYVNNTGTNYFNTTDGVAKGNYYEDARTYYIFDENDDGFGDTGSEYPYNSTETLWFGNGNDYGPIIEEFISVAYGTGITGLYFHFHFNQTNVTIPIYNVSVTNQNGTNGFIDITNAENASLVFRTNLTIDPSIIYIKCGSNNSSADAIVMDTDYTIITNTTGSESIWCWADVPDPLNLHSFSLNWWIQSILR